MGNGCSRKNAVIEPMELPDKPKRLSPSIENLVESIIADRMQVHHQEMAITLQRIRQLEEESRLSMNKIDLQYHYYMADNTKQGNSLPDLTADRPIHKPPTGKRENPAHKSEGDIIDPMESNLAQKLKARPPSGRKSISSLSLRKSGKSGKNIQKTNTIRSNDKSTYLNASVENMSTIRRKTSSPSVVPISVIQITGSDFTHSEVDSNDSSIQSITGSSITSGSEYDGSSFLTRSGTTTGTRRSSHRITPLNLSDNNSEAFTIAESLDIPPSLHDEMRKIREMKHRNSLHKDHASLAEILINKLKKVQEQRAQRKSTKYNLRKGDPSTQSHYDNHQTTSVGENTISYAASSNQVKLEIQPETYEDSITWDEYCQFFDSSLSSISSLDDDHVTAL